MNFSFPHCGEIYSALSALVWAFAVILYKRSGEQVSPVALNLFKNTVALALFVLTMLCIGVAFVPADQTYLDWATLLISGVLGIGIADSVFFASLNRLGAGRSAIVDCLYSPAVILCSFIYLNEPIGPSLLLALALIIAAIMIGTWKPANIKVETELRQIRYGIFLGVIAMIIMAIGIVLAKPIIDKSNPWWSSMVRLLGSAVFLVIQAAFKRDRADIWRCFIPGPLWKMTVPAAVIGSYLAMFFWIIGMKYTYATTASVLNQLSTIIVLGLATIFLKELLTGRKIIAICLGFAGGILAVL